MRRPGDVRVRGALLLAWTLAAAVPPAGAVENIPSAEEGVPTFASAEAPVSTAPFVERLNQPITADFQDVAFDAAIAFLADSAGINIILSEKARELARPVTVHLVEMPLQRALEYLLEGQGLFFRYDRETIWVATRDEIDAEPVETRIFMLNQGPGLSAAFEPLSVTRDSVALQATRIRDVKTIKDILDEVIPSTGNSAILLDERTGSLIVTHSPYYLQQIERLLVQLDVAPLQVMIEARFIELTQTDTKEWNFDAALTGNLAIRKGHDRDGRTDSPKIQLSSTGTSLARGTKTDFSSFTNQTSGNGLNLTLQGVLTGTQYQAILHSLVDNERTKTLSAPRVTALNNQTATIKIVTEYVYATRYEASVVREDLNSDGDFTDEVSGTRETRFVNVPQGFVTKDLGILLNVTPSIGQDLRTITLSLKPEVSEKTDDDEFGGEVTLPRFSARQLETSVVIENGETVVLGGLMQDTTTRTVTKVPMLGSLPVVGKLFRKESDSAERSNLLIFVTANLLDSSGAHLAQSP